MKRNWILALAVLVLIVGLGSAAAAYTGPNRYMSQQVWQGEVQGQTCMNSGGWRYIVEKTYSCDTPGEPWKTEYPNYYYPCSAATNGNKVYATTCQQVTVTVPLSPATVSGSTSCDQPGSNGWCAGGAKLNLSANEPLSGYVITGIESSLGILCSTGSASVSCTWLPPEGTTSLNFWALSSYGDTSAMGSASFQVDTVSPALNVTSPSPDGNFNWFISKPVTVSATASDATSGLASLQGQLDGGTWQSGNISVLTDGIHTVIYRAQDRAGNTTTWTKQVGVDAQPPTLSITIPVVNGSNGWHVTPTFLSVNASDLLSGVQTSELSLDSGATWVPTTTLTDGMYTILGRAIDVAGNSSTTSASVKVDTLPPVVQLDFTGTTGNNGWYTSSVFLTVQASDATSGMNGVQVRLDNGTWQDATTLDIADGIHAVDVRAFDQAGNSIAETNNLNVDTLPPQSAFVDPPEGSITTVSGIVFFSGASQDGTSGLAGASISLDNEQTWQVLTPDGSGNWNTTWDTTTVPNGTYPILVRADDLAGNLEHTAQVIVVVSNAPPSVFLPGLLLVQESASTSITPNGIPLGGARLTISDPTGLSPAYVVTYTPQDIPSQIVWDGIFPDGAHAAPGSYPVLLEAWDIFGNTGEAQAVVIVPQSQTPTVIPSNTPTVLPSPTIVPPGTPIPYSTDVPGLISIETPIPLFLTTATPSASPVPQVTSTGSAIPPFVVETKATPLSQPASRTRLFWPVLGFVALLAALASSSISDPRPRALRRLSQTLDSIQDQNHQPIS